MIEVRICADEPTRIRNGFENVLIELLEIYVQLPD
jgi:hypothetical protein